MSRSLEPTDSEGLRRIAQKMHDGDTLTPEEQQLMALTLVTLAAYAAKSIAHLVKPAVERLTSPEFQASLEQLLGEVAGQSQLVARHQRAIDAEHRES